MADRTPTCTLYPRKSSAVYNSVLLIGRTVSVKSAVGVAKDDF